MSQQSILRVLQLIITFLLLIPFSQELPFQKQHSSSHLLGGKFFSPVKNHHYLNPLKMRSKLGTGILEDIPTCSINNGWVNYENSKLVNCGGQNLNKATTKLVVTGTSDNSKGITAVLTSFETLDITLKSLTLKGRLPLKVEGDGTLNIIIDGENTLESKDEGSDSDNSNGGNINPAIYCKSENANIVIKAANSNSNNKLTVKGGKANPAIGTLNSCNSIKIESGIIDATGGSHDYYLDSFTIQRGSGAGIGTGTKGYINTIWIAGGQVTVHGGTYAAGIGVGTESEVGTIKITGGTITAYGGTHGAAIGAGDSGNLKTEIAITGGKITAYGSAKAAGIGAGNGGQENRGYVETISISANADVTVISNSGQAAGIGGGYGETPNSAFVNTISISAGKVTVQLDGSIDGAAIGGGCGEKTNSAYVKTLTITGGTISALGSYNAAGIGIGMGVHNKYTENDQTKTDNTPSNIQTKFQITTGAAFCAVSRHKNNPLGENSKNGQKYPHTPEFPAGLQRDQVGSHFRAYYPNSNTCPEVSQSEEPEPEPTPTAEPEVEDITPTAEPEVEDITPTAEPEVEDITPTAEPEVEDITPTAEPEVEDITPTAEPEQEEPNADQTPTPENEDAQKNNNQGGGTSGTSEQKSVPWAIIGGAAGALVVAALLTALIIKLKKREKMNPEKANVISNDSSAIITQDNPLYKDGNESDDPFKNDFEENGDSVINNSATQI